MSEDKSLIHQTPSTPTSQLTRQLLTGITNSWGGSKAYASQFNTPTGFCWKDESNPQKTTLISHIYYQACLAVCLVSCSGMSQTKSSPSVTSISAPEHMNKLAKDNIQYMYIRKYTVEEYSLLSALKGQTINFTKRISLLLI